MEHDLPQIKVITVEFDDQRRWSVWAEECLLFIIKTVFEVTLRKD